MSWLCIFAAAPFAAMAFVRYNGMKAEQFAWAWLKSEVLCPHEYHFEANNLYYEAMKKGIKTYIFIDEIYLLFQHEYSANFLFTLWKRVRKYGACCSGITQNIDDLLQSHTARTMLANSEFLIMLNQASTDRIELAKLLGISEQQMSYITNVSAGNGLLKVGSGLIPFVNEFPKDTKMYKLMTTKPGETAA